MDRQGLKQTYFPERYDCLEPRVIELMARVVGYGAETYGEREWRNIPKREHLNHAAKHCFSALEEMNAREYDAVEDNMVNAMVRLMFARWKQMEEDGQVKGGPDGKTDQDPVDPEGAEDSRQLPLSLDSATDEPEGETRTGDHSSKDLETGEDACDEGDGGGSCACGRGPVGGYEGCHCGDPYETPIRINPRESNDHDSWCTCDECMGE